MTTITQATGKNWLRGAGGAVLVAALVIALTSQGRAAADKEKDKGRKGAGYTVINFDPKKLVWPPPPDVTRIKWETMAAGEEDFNPTKKKKSSWMDKLAGVSLPQEEGKPRLKKPYGVAVDSKGLIYVADPGSAAVMVFDLEAKKLTQRGSQELQKPSGVAVDDTDRLFVSDTPQRTIFVYKPEGSLESTFGSDKLFQPVGLAVDNENRFLYVVDGGANRLVVFDADTYKFLRFLGKRSDPNLNAPGTFDRPTFVAVDSDGNVYVTDTFNSRVQMFNADGDFVRMWGKPGNSGGHFMRPKGIAVDCDNHVYVVDTEFNNVQVFDSEGTTLMFFGDRGNVPGAFMLATGIAVDKFNRVIVTEQWTGRMQVFRYVTDKEAAPDYAKQAKIAAEKRAELEAAEKAAAEKVKAAGK